MDVTGSEMRVEDLTGPLDIESRNAELTIDAAKLTKAPFRFNATGGQLRIEKLKTESRIDGRNTDMEVTLSTRRRITIYSTGETIIVTAPPGGYTLDAVATEGISSSRTTISKYPPKENSASPANVRGGGPRPHASRHTRRYPRAPAGGQVT